MQKLVPWSKIWVVSIANALKEEKFYSYWLKSINRIFTKHLSFDVEYWDNILNPVEWVSPEKRAEDINKFINDPETKAIWPIWWGAFTNEILPYIDREVFKKDPKVVCWFSDITALNNAIYAKTWEISFSGPNFGGFSPSKYGSLENYFYFKKMVIAHQETDLDFHEFYYDMSADQDEYPWGIIEDGWKKVIRDWVAEWTIVWGNISTFSLLFGTEFMPDLKNKVLFLEECPEESIWSIRRMLMQLKNQPDFDKIAWIVFGRINQGCLKDYDITWEGTVNDFAKDLEVPVLMNAQFWHIAPIQTFPIWWTMKIDTFQEKYRMKVE